MPTQENKSDTEPKYVWENLKIFLRHWVTFYMASNVAKKVMSNCQFSSMLKCTNSLGQTKRPFKAVKTFIFLITGSGLITMFSLWIQKNYFCCDHKWKRKIEPAGHVWQSVSRVLQKRKMFYFGVAMYCEKRSHSSRRFYCVGVNFKEKRVRRLSYWALRNI